MSAEAALTTTLDAEQPALSVSGYADTESPQSPTWGRAPLAEVDPDVAAAIRGDVERQATRLQMIASENYVSRAVLEAAGSVMTNKYAEGYPKKRYYGGCRYVDDVEELARTRACRLYGADHANVQPHSGSQANMGAYFAFLDHGDTLMALSLPHGGHLTHGNRVNFSARLYRVVSYELHPKTELIDYDRLRQLAREHRPKLIVAGATAYPRIIDFPTFREIADDVGAFLMVDIAHIAGLVATGHHPSPLPYADVVTTSTHKTLRGPRGGMILCPAHHVEAVDKAVFPGMQGGPLMHIIAAKAVAFGEALRPEFVDYCGQVIQNAKALADELLRLDFRLVSGGTDNHLLLVDLTDRGITGKDAQSVLEKAGITVNKNAVPFDQRPPFVTSGIRVGTPALTTRGMKEPHVRIIARMIDRVLTSQGDETVIKQVRAEVRDLCQQFPLPY
jgi:glycine hydroxymethyltransferase